MIKVLHIDDKLSFAGGQRQLLLLYERQLGSKDIEPYLAIRKESVLNSRIPQSDSVFYFNLANELDPRGVYSFYKIFDTIRPDIIQCHTPHSIFSAFIASRLMKKKPKIINVRRVDNPLKSCFKYKIACDHIIAVSQNALNMMRNSRYNKDNISIIKDAVNKERIIKCAKKEHLKYTFPDHGKIKIGSVSMLIYHKGIDILIRAFAELLKDYSKALLYIAGDGDQRDNLERLAIELKIESSIKFLGFIDNPYGFIRSMDMIVFPSRTEGLCSTVLDALVLKTPIIAARAGGIPEMIYDKKNGILFEPGNYHELKEKLMELINNTDLRSSISEYGYDNLPRWSDIDIHYDKYLRIYEKLLK